VGHASGASTAAALAAALREAGARDPVIVGWVADGGLHRTTMPVVPSPQRRAVIAAAAEQLAPGELTCVRVGADGRHAVVGSASGDAVADVLRHAGRPVALVLAPMTLTEDGLWLGVSRQCAVLTLVEGGIPRLSRRLGCGGLLAPSSALARHGGPGPERLRSVLAGNGSTDSDAVRASDDYVVALATETRATLSSWRRNDRVEAPLAYVYGPGAALPTLESRLAAEGVRALAPPPLANASRIDATTQITSLVAMCASSISVDDIVGFRDTHAEARRVAMSRSAARVRRVALGGILGGAAMLGVVIPVAEGRVARHLSNARLHTADALLAHLAPEERAFTRVNAARSAWLADGAAEPDWSEAIAGVLGSAPPGISFVSVGLDDTTLPGSVTVTVEADGGATTFADLESWAHTLAGRPEVTGVFAPSAQSDGGPGRRPTKTSFQLEFTITAKAVQSPRPFPGGPLP
jgi:hypothetical protein